MMLSLGKRTLALVSLVSWALMASARPTHEARTSKQGLLAESALTEILTRGAPILGFDNGCPKQSKTCDWMRHIADNTPLVHMNLPGTHDTATWNYSDATQAALLRYTGPIPPASMFRCQQSSILQSLNDGIRVFDFRYAYNPGNDTIGFHHSMALLSPTTTLEDVLFGLYNWLDNHPTEAVLVSINHEGGTGTPDDAPLQEHIYNIFNGDLAKRYWVQTNGTLGTLGQARGKLTLLQRFTYSLLPSTSTNRIGIHLDASQWTDNSPDITLVYNNAKNQIAYIEVRVSPPDRVGQRLTPLQDFYEMSLPADAGTAANIEMKFNATITHLDRATKEHPDQLFISFASAEHNLASPTVSPRIMALGDGSVPGVDQKLLPWLKERKGKRFGIIMLDFYDAVPGLVEAAIGL
ncbi:PLC-like phosphodiesterase [Collybia nuda]|uniref:PLC-like phosphodiesterase n=1 Tax=Collybia nuda TaxID=64659 RepID=A0A9P5YB24_9AGAR|nr:PLC-like phosphodiesterase [Collybia nuda]